MDIKRIRTKLLMTQGEFARAVGVSFSTVQSWEQEVNHPNFKSMRKILAFCKKKKINIDIGE